MNTLIRKSITALTLAAALGSASFLAGAAEPSVSVKFSDLDLSKPRDAAILYERIELSARLVCADAGSPYDAKRNETFQRCYTAAVQAAVDNANRPQLSAVHRAKSGPVVVSSTAE